MSAGPNALPADAEIHWYRIARVLGHGGFGITYLALDTNLQQPVAIKEYLPASIATRGPDQQVLPLTPEHAGDYAWGLERFISEGRTIARFDHPAIVRVLSVFEANGTAYLVMRFEQGQTLAAIVKERRTLPEAETVALLGECAAGLAVVHAEGFIHRDIKPSNIYVREGGSALLIDFGSARHALSDHTQTLTTLVSPGYAPFEQYQSDGKQQGPWTDVYALAATAYRCVTGVAPLAAVDRGRGVLEDQRDPLVSCAELAGKEYSPAMVAAIDAGLAFRASARPQSAELWRAALAGEAEVATASGAGGPDPADAETEIAQTVVAAPAPTAARRKRWYRRKRWWVAAAVVFALLAGRGERRTVPPPAQEAPAAVDTAPDESGAAATARRHPAASDPADAGGVPARIGAGSGDASGLATRFEQAVAAGNYADAEKLLAEAARRGATPEQVAKARKVIEAHQSLGRVVDFVRENPGSIRPDRLQKALDQAGKALDGGDPDKAIELAKRARNELERKVKRRKD